MSRRNWNVESILGRPAARSKPTRGTSLRVESLEDRRSPATITWTNGGGDTLITSTANWNPTQVPGIFDETVFPQVASGIVTINDSFATFWNQMTVTGKDYVFGGKDELSLAGDLTINIGAGGKSTFNTDLDFFFANSATITVRNQDTKAIFNAGISLSPDDTLTFDGSGEAIFNGRIAAGFFDEPSDIVKRGDGTLTFSAGKSNTYAGSTTVESGKLVLNSTALVTIPGSLVIGNGVGSQGSAIVEQLRSNQIVNSANVVMQGDGLWDLSKNSIAEEIQGLGSESSTSQILLGSSTLTVNPAGPTIFAGRIDGTTGSVTVNNGDQTFTGPVTLSGAGTALLVTNNATMEVQNLVAGNGKIATAAGGSVETLFSSSSSGGITVAANDKFRPAIRDEEGNESPASPLTGTLNLAPTSNTQMRIDSATEFASIGVLQSVASLGNLSIKLGKNYAPSQGESFTLLENLSSNPVGTTFNGFAERCHLHRRRRDHHVPDRLLRRRRQRHRHHQHESAERDGRSDEFPTRPHDRPDGNLRRRV